MLQKHELIAKKEAIMMPSTHLSNLSRIKYTEELWEKALTCDRVSEEYIAKGVSIKGM